MRRHVAALANLDVLHNSHVVEQTNVLEGTSDTHVVCLNNALTSKIVAVDHYGTTGWLVDVGEQVEDSCFTRGELLMKVQNQLEGKDLGDHCFFEGLERVETEDGIPRWRVRLGS